MSSWKTYRLGDLARIQTGPFGSQLHAKDYVGKGIPVIMPANIINNKLNLDGIAQITEADVNRLKKHRVKEGEIVFSRRGDIERQVLIKKEHENWLCGTGCLKVTPNNLLVDSTFLHCRLGAIDVVDWLYNHAVGATMPNLNTEILSNLPIDVPERKEQVKIAKILSSLDDKIELNRCMNQTLEQIAATLFKKYFVDDIDPDNLPEDWKKGLLNEEFDIVMGQSPEGTSYNEDKIGIPFFQGRTDFGFRFPTFRMYTTSPKRFAKKHDVLISVRAPVGDLNIAYGDCCIGRGLGAIRHKQNMLSYGYYKIKSLKDAFEPYNGEGTVFGSINKDELGGIETNIPSLNSVNEFNNKVNPIDAKIYQLHEETEILIKIRDTILPKLMSGEIDLSIIHQNEQLHAEVLS
jgi:type I restriction enzyme, S subunit